MVRRNGEPGPRRARPVAGGDAVFLLAQIFQRNGYVRLQDARRAEQDGPQQYKKGDEVRLVANTLEELALIRRLLVEAGFRPGRPFAHGRQYRQPLYGREAVNRFLELIGGRKRPRGL